MFLILEPAIIPESEKPLAVYILGRVIDLRVRKQENMSTHHNMSTRHNAAALGARRAHGEPAGSLDDVLKLAGSLGYHMVITIVDNPLSLPALQKAVPSVGTESVAYKPHSS